MTRVDIILALKSQIQGTNEALSFLRSFTGSLSLASLTYGAFNAALASGRMAAEIKRLAAEANLTTDAFQRLSKGAQDFGVDQEAIVRGAVTLRSNLEKAASDGASPLNQHLDNLRLTAAGLQALAPERQFEVLGYAIANAADKEKAFAAALAILGKENGPRLLEFLKKLGLEGFDKLKPPDFTPEQLARLADAEKHWRGIADAIKLATAHATNAAYDLLTHKSSPTNLAAAFMGMGGVSSAQQFKSAIEGAKPEAAQAVAKAAENTAIAESKAKMEAAERLEFERRIADMGVETRRSVEAFNQKTMADALEKFRLARVAEAKAEERAAPGRALAGLIDGSNAALRGYGEQINAIQNNPFLTELEKRRQSVEILKQENSAIADQIELLKQFGEVNPGEAAGIRGQIRGLEDRRAGNSRRIGEPNRGEMGLGQLVQADLTAQVSELGTTNEIVARGVGDVWRGTFSNLQNGLSGLLTGTRSFGSFLRQLPLDFGLGMVNAFAKMVAEYAASKASMFLLDTVFAGKSLALSVASAAKSLVAWIPSAIAASISSYGVAAAIGVAAVAAILAASGGFADGGYTGDGGRHEIAGAVHRGEYVMDASTVDRYGVDFFDSLRSYSGPAAGAAGAGRPQRVVHVMARDWASARQLARDPEFDSVMIDWGRRNRGEVAS